jgi:DNA-binding Lrp family transcriptional regulator
VEGLADTHFPEPLPEAMRELEELVAAAPEIVEAHRIAGHHDYVIRFCGGDLATWNDLRRKLEALGCNAQSRFNILVEALK